MTSLVPPGGRTGASPPLVSDLEIIDDNWHHIGIVVMSKESESTWIRLLYLDGVMVALDSLNRRLFSSEGGMYFGAGKTLDAGTFFSGLIDDVRIYNRALSAEEIAALAQ